jgi:hypothetical protein
VHSTSEKFYDLPLTTSPRWCILSRKFRQANS